MVKEFKEFISKGNVMDMAVGIIIGGAFTAIVNSLVESILMPVIGVLSGGLSVADMSVTVGNAVIGYGAFLQAIIDFLLVALVLFSIIKALNKAKAAVIKEEPAEEAPEEVPADIALLTEIRDLLIAGGGLHFRIAERRTLYDNRHLTGFSCYCLHSA